METRVSPWAEQNLQPILGPGFFPLHLRNVNRTHTVYKVAREVVFDFKSLQTLIPSEHIQGFTLPAVNNFTVMYYQVGFWS